MIDLLARKRDGAELSDAEIRFLIAAFQAGKMGEDQMAALLMAICCRGLSGGETFALTQALVDSGRTLDLHAVAPIAADKHSTGGVGDKTTCVVAPLVAACGLPVAKMSGRSLSFTGGTLDKLESFPGLRVELREGEFLESLDRVGLVLAGQSPDLAPAEGKLYALRNLTATVPSIGLIASSIMSKKLAAGADVIVLDVKAGRGAFCRTTDEARNLASLMVEIGRMVGRRMSALISGMDQPLGCAVGNVLEIKEAIAALRGEGPEDLVRLSMELGSRMLVLAGRCADEATAWSHLQRVRADGSALEKLAAMVESQGGNSSDVYDPERLIHAPRTEVVRADLSGYVTSLDAFKVGMACVELGAGRTSKGQVIDHSTGVLLRAKRGSYVELGDPLVEIHGASAEAIGRARELLEGAFTWGTAPPGQAPLITEIIS